MQKCIIAKVFSAFNLKIDLRLINKRLICSNFREPFYSFDYIDIYLL